MSKKLTVIKPSSINLPSIVPPPRKEDVINALVERARVKHADERLKIEARQVASREAFDTALVAELAANPQSFVRTINCRGSFDPEIKLRLDVITPKLKKLRDAINAIPSLRNFDEIAVKKEIRQRLNTSVDRVQALLANAEAVKALDATLEKIS